MNDKDVKKFNLDKLFGQSATDIYVVPLYQREYAWGATEIRQLLDDLWESFTNHPDRNYHLGTLVVCRRFHDGDERSFELIDGQQRLTTLSLLYRVIHHDSCDISRKVRFDNRPMAENFLDAFFSNANVDAHDPAPFRDAVDNISGYHYTDTETGRKRIQNESLERWSQIDSMLQAQKDGVSFAEYILKKVILFRVEMPSTTDVAAYFEVMNNRGRQLELHELVKARLIAKLRDAEVMRKHLIEAVNIGEIERRFDIFWSECSDMRGYLAQRLHGTLDLENNPSESWANGSFNDECWSFSVSDRIADIDRSREGEPQSIIDDFPNFLMHVLRVYCQQAHINLDMDIPLDDRVLDEVFRHYEKQIDPYEFLNCLLRVRLWFDRYIVKSVFEDNAVKEWTLEGIVRTDSVHYINVNTYSADNEREKLIKIESMLQVTYRTRRYKHWLSAVLLEYSGRNVAAKDLIIFLENIILRPRLERLVSKTDDKMNNSVFVMGTNTPALIFTTIDYLLWCEDMKRKNEGSQGILEEFVFAYRSSVEHHHAQQIFQGEDKEDPWKPSDFNDIGNLCLVYPNENSSLSNHSPIEKVLRYKKTQKVPPPKQQIMYSLTLSAQDGAGLWTKKLMNDHSHYIRQLICEFLGDQERAPSADGTAC